MHGGVNFAPYKSEFESIIGKQINYVETYNSSEGFYGIQDQPNSEEMLLMLDYGIFYEFIPLDCFDGVHSKTVVSLKDVELHKNYALVISTNSGLWRYIIGDTISFTSNNPYRFKITGRTTQCLNVFGEEVIVENADRAIAETCTKTTAFLKDYAVFPIFLENKQKGGHEWFIEFSKEPNSKENFTNLLDQKLQEINSDYAAKRQGDFVLTLPKIHYLPENTFENWLLSKNKLGGQHKIPRLNSSREIAEQLLKLV
jgi:hypothetical protein